MSTHDQRMTPRRECRGEGEAAGGEARGREETETQRRDKRARTTQPEKKCPHNQRKSQCVDYITICLQSDVFQTVPWVLAYAVAASMLRGWQPLQEAQGSIERSTCKDCGGTSICPHSRVRSRCKDCGGTSICEHSRQIARNVGAPPSSRMTDRGTNAMAAGALASAPLPREEHMQCPSASTAQATQGCACRP